MIFVAYELNLPLNMEKPNYRSQRASEWSLIWAHDSRPIYRALTYIAVPLLGPHQPRYMGLTLYTYWRDDDCRLVFPDSPERILSLACSRRALTGALTGDVPFRRRSAGMGGAGGGGGGTSDG